VAAALSTRSNLRRDAFPETGADDPNGWNLFIMSILLDYVLTRYGF